MSQQQIHLIDLGEGLYFLQHTFFATLRSIHNNDGIVTLKFIDGSTRELSASQSKTFLTQMQIKKPLIQPAASVSQLRK